MAHTELGASTGFRIVSDAADNGAQIQDANPPPEITDDDLRENLCNLIERSYSQDEAFKDVVELLDCNPHLDLNIAYASELPLHLGCIRWHKKIVERLLAAGANPEMFCDHGRNALQCAADENSLNIDVLNWLTRDKQREEVQKYINSPDRSQDRRATHYVAGCLNHSLNGVYALWRAGADWTLKDQAGNTPFEWAAKNGNWIVTSELASRQWKMGYGTTKIKVDFVSVCDWTHVNVQITAYIQGLIPRYVFGAGSDRPRELICSQIAPDFRLERDSKNPVAGSGRESVYISKKLVKVDFESLVIPYFSSELTLFIRSRKDKYKEDIKDLKYCSDSNFNYLGLQCASTLDEYCHPSLDEDTLADRNEDQVLSRYQKGKGQDQKVILTIPQLWIWIIDKSLITATQKPLPESLGHFNGDFINNIEFYKDKVREAFTSKNFPGLKFSDLIVGELISQCVNDLSSPSRLGLPESIFGIFERSISELSAKVREYTKSEALKQNNIDSEKELTLQIGDVREELSMIQSVLFEQEEVWRQFMKAKFPKLWSSPAEDQFSIPEEITGPMLNILEILERPQAQFAKYKRQIANLDKDAERVEGSITLQLDLKSKHASLQEAHLTTLMSAAVIGFTIITIIFTPLAFLASLLALSTSEFQNHQTNSTLMNGAPFYHSSYIGGWMVLIEIGSLIITGLAIWLALKFTTGWSVRDFTKQRFRPLKEWLQWTDLQNIANAAQTKGQPAAARQPTTPSEGSHSLRKRFQILSRGPRQQHAEEGKSMQEGSPISANRETQKT